MPIIYIIYIIIYSFKYVYINVYAQVYINFLYLHILHTHTYIYISIYIYSMLRNVRNRRRRCSQAAGVLPQFERSPPSQSDAEILEASAPRIPVGTPKTWAKSPKNPIGNTPFLGESIWGLEVGTCFIG